MSETNEEPIKFVLKGPEDWDRWCYLLNNILASYAITNLLDPVQAIREATIPERPNPTTFGGGGALTVRMQSELRDLQDIYNSKVKGRRLSADFIHESTLKHFMETVRAILDRNDIYARYVALRNHVRPLSTVAIHGRLNTACQQAGINLEAVIRQAILVKGMFTQAQQIQIYKTTIAGITTVTVQQIKDGLVSVSEHVEAEGPNYMRAQGKPRAFVVS